ncbi:MAG: hypothetical protein EHM63_05325 [Actinobacteria bacterium]|nr:MAG: hypothetical protein EHM63_05325 [Actinomycetota bacterium]
MPDWSRRDLLRASGVAAVAVPMSTLVAGAPVGAASSSEAALRPEELAAFGTGAVVFHVRDAARGEVAILQGADEVVVRDPQLVARVMRAAQSAQAG